MSALRYVHINECDKDGNIVGTSQFITLGPNGEAVTVQPLSESGNIYTGSSVILDDAVEAGLSTTSKLNLINKRVLKPRSSMPSASTESALELRNSESEQRTGVSDDNDGSMFADPLKISGWWTRIPMVGWWNQLFEIAPSIGAVLLMLYMDVTLVSSTMFNLWQYYTFSFSEIIVSTATLHDHTSYFVFFALLATFPMLLFAYLYRRILDRLRSSNVFATGSLTKWNNYNPITSATEAWENADWTNMNLLSRVWFVVVTVTVHGSILIMAVFCLMGIMTCIYLWSLSMYNVIQVSTTSPFSPSALANSRLYGGGYNLGMNTLNGAYGYAKEWNPVTFLMSNFGSGGALPNAGSVPSSGPATAPPQPAARYSWK